MDGQSPSHARPQALSVQMRPAQLQLFVQPPAQLPMPSPWHVSGASAHCKQPHGSWQPTPQSATGDGAAVQLGPPRPKARLAAVALPQRCFQSLAASVVPVTAGGMLTNTEPVAAGFVAGYVLHLIGDWGKEKADDEAMRRRLGMTGAKWKKAPFME